MKVLIHGLGLEGRAAAAYFAREGAELLFVDGKESAPSPEGGRRISPGEAENALRPGLLYLRSPGVPPGAPLHRAALEAGAEVTTATGYWLSRLAPEATVTVTGTKGKSTTTAFTAAMLRAAGLSSAPYGNIGRPPLGPDLPQEEAPVVEISSYMCHDLPERRDGGTLFHVLTNLYKEHTDWHGGEAPYRASKLRPYRFSRPWPGAAPAALIARESLPASVQAIEDLVPMEGEALLIGADRIDLPALGEAFLSPGLRLAARAAAAAVIGRLGPEKTAAALRQAAEGWQSLPSRQARVPSTDGKIWIDDALATVPEATMGALARFGGGPLRLILGGKDRGQDFSALIEAVAALPDARAFGFGEVAAKLEALGVPVLPSMEDAVRAAASACPKGGSILFSPAAPSGAPHADYKERAVVFAALAAKSA